MKNSEHIVFFDGVCGLCNTTVDFLIRKDKNRILKYAPLQGITAKERLSEAQYQDLDSIVYLRNGSLNRKSTAVLLILFDLGGAWKLISILFIFPRFIRDGVYSIVAKYRYKWFGKKETCRLPSPEERSSFLD
ncbi:MAG: DCC1-like thiol-disulfide oxidoreductase family protein [Flavobacteriales bacterium]